MHVGSSMRPSEHPDGSLFPEIMPVRSGMLQVDGLHTLYWEESGNPAGIPVVFLHGGPGAGSSSKHRQFFDGTGYRIIIYDQRGAGRSTPNAEVRTTAPGSFWKIWSCFGAHLQVDSCCCSVDRGEVPSHLHMPRSIRCAAVDWFLEGYFSAPRRRSTGSCTGWGDFFLNTTSVLCAISDKGSSRICCRHIIRD